MQKNNNDIPLIPVSPEALSYIKLPLNGYYIYKDSATGNLDSVVVRKSSIDTNFSPARPQSSCLSPESSAFYYESYNLLLMKIIGSGEQEWFKGTVLIGGSELRDLSGNVEFGYAFIYPLSQYSSTTGAEYTIPILTIEGKTYNDVAVFMKANDTDSTKDYYRKTTYYWVKAIGIIKREIVTHTSIKTSFLVRKG